jgi:hypothetical protein
VRLVPTFLLALVACSQPAQSVAPTATHPADGTRLVVLLVIDQLPEWAFEAKRPALHGGFERLLATGEWHVGRHPSAATITAPGHALLGTGEPPARSGILANVWWHRDVRRELHATEDIDGAVTTKWLRVPGLGDAVASARTGAKAVSVSLKDRAALLPLGHAGLAIWYDATTATWRTVQQPPAWLSAWNRDHPIAAHFHDVWTPLDAARLATLSGGPDDAPGEPGEMGFGATFPHDVGATKDPARAIFAVPAGNDIVLDTALAAVDAEQLGRRDATDLLVASLSAHDYVAHGWGQESWEAWDIVLRLDARLASFLDELDAKIGAGRWSMIVTSDHGAAPMPERTGHGGRLTFESVKLAANNAAAAVLGTGDWIDDAHYPNIYFSPAMLAQPKSELDSAAKRVAYALRAFPGIERVDRVDHFTGRCDRRTGAARALCLTFDPERSGDLFYLPADNWILADEDEPLATGHGSLHDYDTLVPVIVVAPDRGARHDAATAPTGELAMDQIAPMLARWLGVPAPSTLAR